MADPPAFVLDTSAIIAVLRNEPERPLVVSVLETARASGARVQVPFLVLMEVEYLLLREHAPADVDGYLGLVSNWPVSIVESSLEWRRAAAAVKAAGNISVVDAWVAALGLLTDAEVLHKDRQFEGVSGLNEKDIRR